MSLRNPRLDDLELLQVALHSGFRGLERLLVLGYVSVGMQGEVAEHELGMAEQEEVGLRVVAFILVGSCLWGVRPELELKSGGANLFLQSVGGAQPVPQRNLRIVLVVCGLSGNVFDAQGGAHGCHGEGLVRVWRGGGNARWTGLGRKA